MVRARFLILALVTVAFLAVAGVAAGQAVPVVPNTDGPGQFLPSEECGCHAAQIEDWLPTMHSKALTDPLYLAKVEEADKATDGALGPFCKKCHGPAATMMGEIASGQPSTAGSEGVTCMFCHQAVGLADGKVANTSHLIETTRVRRAQLKDPEAPHPAAYSAFHETSEICGGCHNVDHPVNGMHLEATYTEWKESPYAAEGVQCQDCHMSEAPGVIGPSTGKAAAGAQERDNIYRMTFVGGNVAQGPAEEAAAMLGSAAEISLEISDVVAPGETTSATVTITNVGAGHYLPTGLTEVRQMWLEVYSMASDGTTMALGERQFGTILEDEKGNAPVELWEAVKIKTDDRIPPREAVTESYEFTMPEGVDAGEVVAVLNYRSAPDEMAEKAGVDNPITEMAKVTQAVYGSEEAKRAVVKQDASAGSGGESLNLIVIFVGLAVVLGVVAFFWQRSRKTGSDN